MRSLWKGAVQHGSAQAAVSFVGGVLLVRFGGVLTNGAMASMMQGLRPTLRPDTKVLIADCSTAVVALTDLEIGQLMLGDDADALPSIPAVIVASEADHDRLHEHAVRTAVSRGSWRVVARRACDAMPLAHRLMRLAVAREVTPPRPGS